MAAAQQDLANRDLLEPILALLPTLNIIRARSVAQIWRDAVDGSPATSPIQTKQFFTPLPITEVEYDYSWTIYLITRRTGQTHRGPVGGPRNIYPVVTIQPALDIWPNRMPDRWRADFYMPLKTLITLADTRWEKRAFISQPPVKKVVLVDREATLPNLRRVMIETEDGVTFGHLAKSIVAHTMEIENHWAELCRKLSFPREPPKAPAGLWFIVKEAVPRMSETVQAESFWMGS